MNIDELPPFLRIEQCAQILGCSKATVRAIIRSGRLPALRAARTIRVNKLALLALALEPALQGVGNGKATPH